MDDPPALIVAGAAIVGATLVVAQGRHKACPYRRLQAVFMHSGTPKDHDICAGIHSGG